MVLEASAVARIFYGRREMLDDAVLEAVKQLNDDFWVLAEFDLDHRNIDWLIIRAVPDDRPEGRFSTLYLTELKRTSAQLSGGEHGRWTIERNGVATEIVPSNKADENHWHQAINVSHVVRDWLYLNQRRYRFLHLPEYGETSFKLWPTLLILSNPPDLQHRLPLKPANRFGAFHYDLGQWLAVLKNWEAKDGIQLTARELARLVDAIGLQELIQSATLAQRIETQGTLDWIDGFTRWAKGIEERLSRLEDQYHIQQTVGAVAIGLEKRLERMEAERKVLPEKSALPVAGPAQAAAKPKNAPAKSSNDSTAVAKAVVKPPKVAAKQAKGVTTPANDPAERSLDNAEKAYFATALTNLRAGNKSRTSAMLFSELNRLIGGETLKKRKYNGYGSARKMLDRAKEEKLIRFGPADRTGMPTIYSYDETVPQT
jgi:hypothetical protein